MSSFVFIDSQVPDIEALIAGLELDAQVVILDASQDGVTQIVTALAGVTDLESIHIISHGSSGTLYLGSTVLSGDNLDDYQSELTQIGNALSDDGDLLLYGCNLAAGTAGQSFIDKFARYTGADVAASVDATGNSLFGGDWVLEKSSGTIEATAVISVPAQDSYAYTLDTFTGGAGADSLMGTAGSDLLTGLGGNDTLAGSAGADTLNGGVGNDVLVFDAADSGVTGGTGTDTLRVDGGGVVVDLTAIADTVHIDLEIVDLTGSGDNTLTLALSDVLAISSTTNTVRIFGNAGDVVNSGAGWTFAGHTVIDAQTYGQYTKGAATLQVDTSIDRTAIAPMVVELSALDGTDGFRLSGAAAGDRSGNSVSAAGDVNGDGLGDLLIGAYTAAPNGSKSGASYVVFGKTSGFGSNLELSALDGTTGFRLSGAAAIDYSGVSVSSAGDVNGDGFADLVIGAINAGPIGSFPGASYVVFGKASGFASNIELSALNGTTGFRLVGVATGDFAGFSVSAAGDVNGDGFGDLVIGAWHADPSGSNSGASYVVFGKASGFASNFNLSVLNGTTGFKLSGVAAGDGSGRSVSAAGDVNGDGFDDLIIGAAAADPNGNGSGASYVVFGKASGFASNLELSSLDGTTGFKLSGVAAIDQSGFSVSEAGDVNGDRFDDLVIGAFGADPNGFNSGASYVVFGTASGFAANLELSALNGTDGFKLSGAATYDRSGHSVSAAGDVNGDGFADLVVGAANANPNGTSSGATYVIFGKASGFASSVNLSTLDGTIGFRLSGVAAYDYSGGSVSSAGDVNGDGFGDLVIGAVGAAPNGIQSGASYVVFGGDFTGAVTYVGTAGPDVLSGTAASERFVAGLGDDTLSGSAGADTLDGGLGDDILAGGGGNDSYVVDSAGDVVTEASSDGADIIQSSVTITALAANVEKLALTGSSAIDGKGNSLRNNLTGNSGDNSLSGGAGIDTLAGGAGNDTMSGGAGIDTVAYETAISGVTVSLAANAATGGAGSDTLSGFERATGSSYGDKLTGNAGNNMLTGLGDNDTLIGGGGNDILAGGAGNDRLTGGSGADKFDFTTALNANTNVERIIDFSVDDDLIRLDNDIFIGLATGTLVSGRFYSAPDATAAHDPGDRIIYNSDTGRLYYDADGLGGAEATHFATLTGAPVITAADFFIVA